MTVTERLGTPVDTIPDMYFSVSLNKSLLSPELVEKLNPLVLKVHSATNMPNKPVSYSELRARLSPSAVHESVTSSVFSPKICF